MNELIRVTQLPIIEEQLRSLGAEIDRKVAEASALVCTEETVKSVKKVRAELSAQFSELENQRKAVKAAVLDPYNAFESVYQEYVSSKYRAADGDLKTKIGDVEDGLKQAKIGALSAYFSELCQAAHIDFLTLENTGINVTLSASMKSLKEQAKAYVARVSDDIVCINVHEFSSEVMAEYMHCHSATQAMSAVTERHREIARQSEAAAYRTAASTLDKQSAAKTEAFAPPTVSKEPIDPDDEILELTFTVTDPRRKLKALKNFLIIGEYHFK